MPSLPQEGVIPGSSPLDLSTELPYQCTMKRKVRKKKKKGVITANVAGTKFEIVRLVIDEMGFIKTPDEDETSNLIWCDAAVQQEKITELQNYQRINHFPGMGEICRKDFLARNMTKMIKSRPLDYSFVPRTWIFPSEYTQFQNYVKELKKKRKQKTFIVKPANGAMGHGISLIRNGDKIPSQDHLIVQEYIEKPFLMEGYKFDLRIYILVTSCDPLKIFLYHDGLVRMGTEKYIPPNESNLTQLYMHLTNYSVNKHNERFERNETEDKGSKRSIKWFTEFLQANQHDVSKFWNDISELVVKTLIVAEPHVLHAYRMCRPGQPPGSQSVCFEVLGFDILLDRKLKPWLLEINRAPSFGTDQKIDYDVKKGVLLNALKLLNIRTSDKRKNMAKQKAEAQKRLYGQNPIRRLSPGSSDWEQQRHQLERRKEELKERLVQVRKQVSREEHENRHMGNYRRIYPPEDKTLLEKYESLLAVAFQTFLSGRAASFQRELNNPLKKMREEDILDLLEQCEIDDEKLMGKTTRIRGPKPLCCMPECAEVMKKQKSYYSSESSCDSSSGGSSELDENEKELYQKRRDQAPYNLKHTSHCKLIQQSNSMRRSVSCPRSISAHLSSNGDVRPFSSQQVIPLARSTSASRSHSLNRASSYTRHVPNSTDASSPGSHSLVNGSLRQLKTKEQEDDLTSQTLFVLKDMRVRFPGKSDAESELLIEDIMGNWKHYKTKVASYWLIKLDSVKQRKVLDIVKSSIRTVLPRIWRVPDAEELSLYRIFNRVFNRLLWSHGQGLWSCFCDSGSSWESIFSKSPEVVTPLQLQCCQRLVELCKQCLLVVYKYTNETRGPISGIGPDWGNSRYLLPGSTQFLMRSPLYNMKYNSSGMTRSNVLFTSRYGHL
uniref:tubulin polyglutamylase TTLL7 isoform X1 n=1 Tax=Myodes glareolus TaxID=447135 RepID=UPI0020207691|nr:tubulin polyglutamylase TTLL7 isoform X1 [Myodes glareolus]XP_048309572.1 tubulin polyglutamylase TTLL7 isoform X1 [Myodes glareolus]XP_048309573.1 tubulin polyglutamylase TTLL7 isoform X1 [Myodes glareolus]XP_048309574.1 tubulin polyglutamylase TTLL7 isoform X1 [Myodes glareolus]